MPVIQYNQSMSDATTSSAAPAQEHQADAATAHNGLGEHVDETAQRSEPSSAAVAAAAAAALDPNADPAERDHIERDVSNILAGLNQEQLASIVAAARASEARNGDAADGAAFGDGIASGLGQAASALTSIASGLKRSAANDKADAKDLGDAPPPPGVEYPDQLDGKELDADTSAAIAAVKSATDSATAAAIASLGSLAAASHLQQPQAGQAQPHPGAGEADESMDYDSAGGSASPARGLKRPRGPELDRQRKDNHKEVERRRRSAINDGITQLSMIVPGCEEKNTNKGAIIHAAARYIQDLKHNEASNIEKWTLEKLLMDQAMGDLTAQLDDARAQIDRLRAELDNRYSHQIPPDHHKS